MITKFKIFESEKRLNWVIPLKIPDFIICLRKIGMTEKQINDWIK